MQKILKYIKQHKNIIILLLILILASFLRLYKIGDYLTFLGDEGRDLLEVRRILSGDPVLLGPRSSAADFYYGPIYFYFITPFLWLFNYDPTGPAVFVALVGIATVFLVYYVGKKLFNETTGLIAAALYTVSPIVIAYSRSSWNPNPLPFISLLILYLVYKAVISKSIKLFFIIGILFGIAIQLQYLALYLGAIVFLFILLSYVFWEKKKIISQLFKNYSSILIGFIIGWSPFLAFEFRHNFPNIKTIISYIFFGSSSNEYALNTGFLQNVESAFTKLFARLVLRFPPPDQLSMFNNIVLDVWYIIALLLAFLSIIFLFKSKNKLAILLIFLWFFVGLFLFGFYKKEIYDYYLGFMFPLPFLLIANFLSTPFKNNLEHNKIKQTKKYKNIIIKYIFPCLSIIVFICLFLYNLDGNPFKSIPNRQKDQVKQIAEFILSKTDNKPYNFALLTKGNSDHSYRYFFEIEERPPVEIKNSQIDPERKSVTQQLLVVCEYTDCEPVGAGLWEIAGFGRAEIENEWNISVVKVFKLKHYQEK